MVPDSAAIARSKWVHRWILRIQAGIARASSGPLDIGCRKITGLAIPEHDESRRIFVSVHTAPSSSTPPTPSVYQAIPTVNIPTTERNVESID